MSFYKHQTHTQTHRHTHRHRHTHKYMCVCVCVCVCVCMMVVNIQEIKRSFLEGTNSCPWWLLTYFQAFPSQLFLSSAKKISSSRPLPTHFLSVLSESNTLLGLASWEPLQGMMGTPPTLVVVRKASSFFGSPCSLVRGDPTSDRVVITCRG